MWPRKLDFQGWDPEPSRDIECKSRWSKWQRCAPSSWILHFWAQLETQTTQTSVVRQIQPPPTAIEAVPRLSTKYWGWGYLQTWSSSIPDKVPRQGNNCDAWLNRKVFFRWSFRCSMAQGNFPKCLFCTGIIMLITIHGEDRTRQFQFRLDIAKRIRSSLCFVFTFFVQETGFLVFWFFEISRHT